MANILYLLCAILLLGVIVCVHELGHYLAARALGIGVDEFSIGFGPKLLGWTRKGIRYSVRAIPLGGYCKFFGEDETDARPDAFSNQPVWKRFVTVFSGPFMNFVLAYVAVFVFLTCVGFTVSVPYVAEATEGRAAALSGLQAGDQIVAINGETIPFSAEGAETLLDRVQKAQPDQPISFTVQRGDGAQTVSVLPEKTDAGYQIGILLGVASAKDGFFQAFPDSFTMLVHITGAMLDVLKNLFFKGEGLDETVGPVGLISLMTKQIQQGFEMVLNLLVMISLNLGIVNLLPLPALDGGRLVFLLVEAIRRKPIKPEYEGWVHAAGFVLLLGLILVITYQDIVGMLS